MEPSPPPSNNPSPRNNSMPNTKPPKPSRHRSTCKTYRPLVIHPLPPPVIAHQPHLSASNHRSREGAPTLPTRQTPPHKSSALSPNRSTWNTRQIRAIITRPKLPFASLRPPRGTLPDPLSNQICSRQPISHQSNRPRPHAPPPPTPNPQKHHSTNTPTHPNPYPFHVKPFPKLPNQPPFHSPYP